MGTQDDDLRDRPEPGQATPRTTVQDAGGNEGGSLSAARLLRSLGKFVGLGSDVPSPVPSDPARLDITTNAEGTDVNLGGGVRVIL